MVQIILMKDVDNLGETGDVVDVKAGYARNFLLPGGIALEATPSNLRRFEEEREHLIDRSTRELGKASELASTGLHTPLPPESKRQAQLGFLGCSYSHCFLFPGSRWPDDFTRSRSACIPCNPPLPRMSVLE